MKLSLAYAARTLIAPWAFLLAILMEAANFLQRGMPWRGEGMWTVEWFAISLFIIGPLCAGVAAVDAARLTRPGNVHLVLSVPRPARVYIRAAAWLAVPLGALHLLAIVVGIAVGQVTDPSISWWSMLVAALVQCGVILWYTSLGSMIGRFSSPLVAGILGGGVGFLLSYMIGDAASGKSFQLLATGAATVSRIGLSYNPGYLLGQAAILVLTAALFIIIPVRSYAGFRAPSPSGLIAAAVAIVAIVAASTTLPANRVTPDAQPAPPSLCTGQRPQVCIYDEHRRFAETVDTQVRTLTSAALRAGYPALVPDKVMENSRTYRAGGPGVRSLWLPSDLYENGRLSFEEVLAQLVTPAHCPRLQSEVPPTMEYDQRYFSVLATWLNIAEVKLDHPLPVATKQLSPTEVADIMYQFELCDLDGTS